MSARSILAIFAKQPQPGRVKTRLCPPLTPRQAARLYHCCLRETMRRTTAGDWQTALFFQGRPSFFSRAFPEMPLFPQSGMDLGARLAQAFASRFAAGAGQVVIIGSDSPDLPASLIRRAFAALDTHDTVLAPADDGGYVLIGLRQPVPALFTDIPWSTDGVLAKTRERILDLGLRCLELPGWYDLDDVASLRQLLERSPDSDTARLAARLLDAAPH